MLTQHPSRRSVIFSGLALVACGGSGVPTPTVESAEVTFFGPIFVALSVRLSGPGDVEVEYAADGGQVLRVRSMDPTQTTHILPLTRLRAQSVYRFRARVIPSNSIGLDDLRGEFSTTALPADLARLSFSVTGTPSFPLIFLSCRSEFTGGVIVDSAGQVVWYARTPTAPQGAFRRRNGNWVILMQGVGLQEFDSLGRLVQSLHQGNVPGNQTIHHGVTETPGRELMFLTFEPKFFGSESLSGEALWLWAGGETAPVKRWSAWDYFNPSTDRGPRSIAADWFHANSISFGAAGNLLVSFHFLDQVISIAPDFRSVEWRLGGPGGSFPLAASQVTSGQHSVREVGPGRVLLFDNGFARADQGRWSRALELEIDRVRGVVNTVSEYRPTPDIWATVISSARRTANGNTVVTFGTPAGIRGSTGPLVVHEINAAGNLLSSIRVDASFQTSVFQGDPIDSVGGEAP